MKSQLIFPMAFYGFYIGLLAIFLFASRLRGLKAGQATFKYFKTYHGEAPADRLLVIGRHYDNQFQLPMLFFIVCLAHMICGPIGGSTLGFAWGFVATRLLHSIVHLGRNNVPQRAFVFGLGWILITILWAQLIYFAIQNP